MSSSKFFKRTTSRNTCFRYAKGLQNGEEPVKRASYNSGCYTSKVGRDGAARQTVATGVTGEPTAPGKRSGGAVRRKRWR